MADEMMYVEEGGFKRFLKDFANGSIAGAIANYLTQPLDTVRVNNFTKFHTFLIRLECSATITNIMVW